MGFFFFFQDEIIYQETRRLVSAEMQNIVYGEYLPTVLGVDYMRTYSLIVEEETRYDESVDPGILNPFATAAFRSVQCWLGWPDLRFLFNCIYI